MNKEIIILEEPKIPVKWDYNQSVKKVKILVYKWKNLTEEVLTELFIARDILINPGARTDLKEEETWTQYCLEIGSDRHVVNRWIKRYFQLRDESSEVPPNPIKGVHSLIVIDPPWPYGTEYDEETRRVASPYKEMDINEIIHLSEDYMFKLPKDKPIVLWLWTTNKFIHDAYHILEAWDFEPKSLLVWDKESMGIGEWLRIQTEYALLAVKGKPDWNCTNQRNIISSKRREHSRKPDEFYKLAEELSPNAKKRIDIFGREKRPGWETYGNQPDKF